VSAVPGDRPSAGHPGDADRFEAARPRLLGLAYRMLGSMADAEDVVQDAWLRFQAAGERVDRPEAWLTTVTTRLAVDRLRAARRRREDYVGPWLPEPVVLEGGPDEAAELSESLTLGFLTLLDRLGPVERAVFLLADVFALPFADIAAAVGRSPAACRQIASRARQRLVGGARRRPVGAERRVVDELIAAIALGDIQAALNRLAPDAVLVSDGGPSRRAARRPVVGSARVARLLINLARRYGREFEIAPVVVNGDPGLLISAAGRADTVLAFEVDGDVIAAIFVVRNPDKLEQLSRPVFLA
jgi:RNA polymerase sigma-70 factor (ECF subfamily)